MHNRLCKINSLLNNFKFLTKCVDILLLMFVNRLKTQRNAEKTVTISNILAGKEEKIANIIR